MDKKKRGRKPKIQDAPVNKIPKKRGRKPKDKVYSVIDMDVSKSISSENIILHLPITQIDIDRIDNDSLIGNEISHPIPYQPDTNYQEVIEKNNNEENHNDENNVDNGNKVNTELCQMDDMMEKKLVKRNLINIMYKFIDGNSRKQWPTSTDIYCMWCCHPFDMMPCALPERIVRGKFYVYGNFCSFNCAGSYNFDSNPYNVWERYSLLNLLYRKMYNVDNIKIKLAPPRNTLKIFGGFLSIEDFRKNFLMNTTYTIVVPPMVSLVPRVEENIYETVNKTYIPIDKEAMMDVELKLKRDKPLTNPKTTLESYMDLKIL